MKTITIVTGNPGKVKDLNAISLGKFNFKMHDIDLEEIQSLDLEAIVVDKVKKAYKAIKGPVIVDDVSAGLRSLNGLPGPFIKFFNKQLGGDALYQLAKNKDDKVDISCIAAYYDGKKLVLARGDITGRVVSPAGNYGFGFDVCVIADGQTKRMAEMPEAEKMSISHRGKAFRELIDQL